jgi:hypothetical protein
MQIKEDHGHLILIDSMYLMAAACAGGGAICAWQAIAQDEYSLWAGTVMFLFAAFITWRADRFEFDPHSKRVNWTRWIRWKKETGSLPFGAILDIRLEMTSRNRSGLWRIVFDTPTGRVPLLSSFSGSRRDWEAVATKIREVLGKPDPADTLERDLRGLIKNGRRIEAILMHGTVTSAKYADSKRAIEELETRMARET